MRTVLFSNIDCPRSSLPASLLPGPRLLPNLIHLFIILPEILQDAMRVFLWYIMPIPINKSVALKLPLPISHLRTCAFWTTCAFLAAEANAAVASGRCPLESGSRPSCVLGAVRTLSAPIQHRNVSGMLQNIRTRHAVAMGWREHLDASNMRFGLHRRVRLDSVDRRAVHRRRPIVVYGPVLLVEWINAGNGVRRRTDTGQVWGRDRGWGP